MLNCKKGLTLKYLQGTDHIHIGRALRYQPTQSIQIDTAINISQLNQWEYSFNWPH